RSATLSQPIDELRQRVRNIQAQIQPHLDRLQAIADMIKTERADLPQVREADAALWRTISAGQRLKEAKSIVDTIEAAHEYQEELKEVIDSARGWTAGAREAAQEARHMPGAEEL